MRSLKVDYRPEALADLQSIFWFIVERSAVIAYRVHQVVEVTNVFYGGRDYEALYRGTEDDA